MNKQVNFEYPKSVSDIITGRSSLDNWLKNNYYEFYEYLIDTFTDALSIKERIYMFYNNINKRPVCYSCKKPVKFHGYIKGFGKFCCPKCAQNDKTTRDNYMKSVKEKYGEDAFKVFSQKGEKTKLERYGDKNYNNTEKNKQTCLERYGVDNPMKSKKIREKSKQTCLEKYGTEYITQSDYYKSLKSKISKKHKQTCLERYGVDNPMKLKSIHDKINKTCLERYGVEWNCMRKEAHNSKNTDSLPNLYIKQLLEKYNIEYEREFPIKKYIYDFKVNNILLEINPYATHNTTWNPFKNVTISKNYHKIKTNIAKENGYKIINIWDWDDTEKIIKSLLPKTKLYARKCTIKIVNKNKAKQFLSEYHFQGNCRNQKIILGLFYNNELIQLISFGKPRYNKNYEYELLRLCTKNDIYVIGGTEKLFNYFIKNYNPSSIISYCDESKFTGKIYKKLGFIKDEKYTPSRHWYDGKTHITDNLLRQKGFDKLFGTNYGKNTSNKELMITNGFVEIYDVGQSTWKWYKIL